MNRFLRIITPAIALSAAMLPAVAGAARPADMGMGSATVTATARTGGYRLTLIIGPIEKMYPKNEFNRTHPKHGEVMLRGSMVMAGMGDMNMPNHHLELHVYSLSAKRAIANAMVTITYQRVARMGAMPIKPQNVPIAVMYGIGMGMGDVHYGNNVHMTPGSYKVFAHVNAASATFTVKLT